MKVVEVVLPNRGPYGVGPLAPDQAERVRGILARLYPSASVRVVPVGNYPKLGTTVDLRKTPS